MSVHVLALPVDADASVCRLRHKNENVKTGKYDTTKLNETKTKLELH